jgi:hypothetical protein
MTRVARALAAIVGFATIAAGATGAATLSTATPAAGSTVAVIVIDYGSHVRTAQVDVGSGESGLAALQQVASVTTQGFAGPGAAVCAIDGVGNPAGPSCLEGPNGEFWSYWHGRGGSWSFSSVGAAGSTIRAGDVDGWRWQAGQSPPRGSADFCSYVACAPPPTAAPPPAPLPTAGSSPGGAAAATPGASGASGGTSAAAGATRDPGTTPSTAPDASTPTSSTPAGTTGGAPATTRHGTGVEAAAASAGRPDHGSPTGVLVAAALLAVAVAAAVWVRRRKLASLERK